MLSAEHRRVIVEMYYHHRSVAETAELLCIRASKVVSLASAAVRQLPSAVAASASRRQPDRTGCGTYNGSG
jgi:DNA-directed RNA polymerase specialized sigma24 family protein